MKLNLVLLLLYACYGVVDSILADDASLLSRFYEEIASPGAQFCGNKTLLRPACTSSIPGVLNDPLLVQQYTMPFMRGHSYGVLKGVHDLRESIARMTLERYGARDGIFRYGLYPYLEHQPFLFRQVEFGQRLDAMKPRHVVDIGAYYNPIHLFMTQHCPEVITIIEPILDPLSVTVPCPAGRTGYKSTTIHVLPITSRFYMFKKASIQAMLGPPADAVVCIGCDHVYGPNRKHLEQGFQRPFRLFIEYPTKYTSAGAFAPLCTTNAGAGTTLQYSRDHVLEAKVQFKDRSMRVVDFA